MCSRLKASSIMSEGRSGARSVRCGYIGIVLNECVAQTGDSQVIKERNTTSECGGRVDPLGFDVVCRV